MNEHTRSGYSLFTHCSFDKTKNKLDCYRGKDCMERFCKELKEHVTKIINYDTKEMISLTSEERKLHRKQKKNNLIYTKKDLALVMTIKNLLKLEIIVIILENIEEMLMIFVI